MGSMRPPPRSGPPTLGTWEVARSESGWRLVDFVFDRLSFASPANPLSRSEARRVVVAGAARVDGVVVRRPGFVLRSGMQVETRRRSSSPQSEPAPTVRVLFDDGVLLAVDKPAGLPTVPSADPRRPSLVSLIEEQLAPKRAARDGWRLGVHQRLDAQTSGVVLFVLDPRANAALARQIEQHQVSKRYVALVARPSGAVPDSFVIDAPVGESPNGPGGRMTVREDGRVAVTAVRVLESLAEALLVEARPATGRKHQIRVHLASRGLPILGDPVYSTKTARSRAPRLMLHASEITLAHPLTGCRLQITSGPPHDFLHALRLEREKLRSPRPRSGRGPAPRQGRTRRL